jgi:hypothetical protein
MLQNGRLRRNIQSFLCAMTFQRLLKAKPSGDRRDRSAPQRLRGRSPNILDFCIPQKHVGRDMPAW